MGIRSRSWTGLVTSAFLVLATTGATVAQAEVEPPSTEPGSGVGPGTAEVALCLSPELGEEVGSGGPSIASIADVPLRAHAAVADVAEPGAEPTSPIDFGCTFPQETLTDQVSGRPTPAVVFPGMFEGTSMASPLVAGITILQPDLRRRDIADLLGQRDVAFVGRRGDFGAGPYTVIIFDHAQLPADVAANIQTSFDRRLFNDAPTGPDAPDSPLVHDGLYSVFAGDGPAPRVFSTRFPDYYQSQQPFAARMTSEQTTFVIPPGGVGSTITPFIFSNGEYHTFNVLPNGALPVDGYVPLFPTCLSQYVVHEPLYVQDVQVSASGDVISACFRLTPLGLEYLSDPGGLNVAPQVVTITFDSYDADSRDVRSQTVVGSASIQGDRLYVAFPSGLLRYGSHVVTNVRFGSVGIDAQDWLLQAAGDVFSDYLVGISVGEPEGLYQGLEECVPHGDVPLRS